VGDGGQGRCLGRGAADREGERREAGEQQRASGDARHGDGSLARSRGLLPGRRQRGGMPGPWGVVGDGVDQVAGGGDGEQDRTLAAGPAGDAGLVSVPGADVGGQA
jgi:hypothetical protein